MKIEPAEDGRSARITLDWHEPFRISDDNPLTTSRVDIGVFANNGVHDSAPAILSWYFPPEEARSYAPGPDGTLRIAAIDYAGRPQAYADPMLIPRADWRDDYHYAPDGTLTGWTRTRGERTDAYDAAGARILVPAAGDAPARVEARRLPARAPARRRARDRGGLGPALSRGVRTDAVTARRSEIKALILLDPARTGGAAYCPHPGAATSGGNPGGGGAFRARNAQGRGARAARARQKARKAASGLLSGGRPLPRQSRSHSASSQ